MIWDSPEGKAAHTKISIKGCGYEQDLDCARYCVGTALLGAQGSKVLGESGSGDVIATHGL